MPLLKSDSRRPPGRRCSSTSPEALELALYGTKLFHRRTFIPLMRTNVPMVIRNTNHPGPEHSGTVIHAAGKGPFVGEAGGDSENKSSRCYLILFCLGTLELRFGSSKEFSNGFNDIV